MRTRRPPINLEKRVIGALYPQILKELRKNEAFLCSDGSIVMSLGAEDDDTAPVLRQATRLRNHETQMHMTVRNEDGTVSLCEVEYVLQIIVHEIVQPTVLTLPETASDESTDPPAPTAPSD